jgi:hypothetical protein
VSIEQTDLIDIISIDRLTGEAVLTVSDPLAFLCGSKYIQAPLLTRNAHLEIEGARFSRPKTERCSRSGSLRAEAATGRAVLSPYPFPHLRHYSSASLRIRS